MMLTTNRPTTDICGLRMMNASAENKAAATRLDAEEISARFVWNRDTLGLSLRRGLCDSTSYEVMEAVFWLAMGNQLRVTPVADVK